MFRLLWLLFIGLVVSPDPEGPDTPSPESDPRDIDFYLNWVGPTPFHIVTRGCMLFCSYDVYIYNLPVYLPEI